jgi:hypothetical protein
VVVNISMCDWIFLEIIKQAPLTSQFLEFLKFNMTKSICQGSLLPSLIIK